MGCTYINNDLWYIANNNEKKTIVNMYKNTSCSYCWVEIGTITLELVVNKYC